MFHRLASSLIHKTLQWMSITKSLKNNSSANTLSLRAGNYAMVPTPVVVGFVIPIKSSPSSVSLTYRQIMRMSGRQELREKYSLHSHMLGCVLMSYSTGLKSITKLSVLMAFQNWHRLSTERKWRIGSVRTFFSLTITVASQDHWLVRSISIVISVSADVDMKRPAGETILVGFSMKVWMHDL